MRPRGLFDYYTYRTAPLMSTVRYYFEIDKDNERCFYNTLGVTTDLQNVYSFKLIPGFSTPEWAKGAVMLCEDQTIRTYYCHYCSGFHTTSRPEHNELDDLYLFARVYVC